ncbi:unnamed protein product, partial [marine sediment metagenome]
SSPRINYLLYGGLPKNRLIEFSGDEGAGKTTAALDIIANFQKEYPKEKVAFIDCENTLDEKWATKLNVNVPKLIILKPQEETAEDIFQIVRDLVDTGEFGLVVIDSFGVMMSQEEYDKDMDKSTIGGIAKPLTRFAKDMVLKCRKYNCTLLGINQFRDKVSVYNGGKTTVGGRGWKHNCSVRMEFSKSSMIDADGKEINRNSDSPKGHLIQARIVKNKICPSDRPLGFCTLQYGYGIDWLSDMIDVAKIYKIVH